MAASVSSLSATSTILQINCKPKSSCHHVPSRNINISSYYQPLISPLTLSKQNLHLPYQISLRKPTNFKASATSDNDAVVNVIQSETTQQIVSSTSGDDGVTTIISTLLFIAFVALSILTIGVVYIGVTDFLQKREKDKFEKEEAATKKKKSGKKVQTRAKAGPRGFGQKFDHDLDD